MAFTVDEAFQKSYAGFLTAVLQQQDSYLQNLVTMAGGYRGEKVQPVKFVGTFEFGEKLSRLQEVVYIEPPYSARALAPRVWRVAPIFDRQDELFIGFSPQGAIAQGGRYAMNRKKDSIIAGSFFGSALTGKDGSTSTPFDTTNQDVATSVGGANTGFSYAKFLAGWQILGQQHALDGGEEVNLILSYDQQTRFLKELEVISSEYNIPVTRGPKGNVTGFMGANIVVQDFPELKPSANLRYVPMWVKSGVHYGAWEDLFIRFDEVAHLGYAPSIFHEFTANATRLDEKKVVRIQCYETT